MNLGETSTDRAAVLVGAGILLSRMSGIVREMVLSALLGVTTMAAEGFAFALGIPKILQNLLGEGALSASFIPVYSQVVDRDPTGARQLAGAVFGLLAALVGGAVVILMVAARPITWLIARGAGPERIDLIASLTQIMAPGIGFIVFAAWCLGILNSHRDFFLSYVAPMLWNAAIVAALLVWATRTDDLVALGQAAAWGVFAGGVAQFAVQMPRVLRIAGPITPTLDRSGPAIAEVIRRFGPGVAGRGVLTLSTFVDMALASFLAVGALSVLVKAQQLYLLPISVFALAIAAADLPELSRETADADVARDRVHRSVDRVLFFLVFSALVFILGGQSVVAALFQRGQFSADDTVVVWYTLAVFSLGLVASGLSRLFQNAAFSRGDVSGPAKIALVRMVVAAVIGAALMFTLDGLYVSDGSLVLDDDHVGARLPTELRDQPNSHRLGAVGLAAGGAVAAWLEYWLLRRRVGPLARHLRLGESFARLIPAALAAAMMLWVMARLTPGMPAIASAVATVAVPGMFYLGIAGRTGNHTAIDLKRSVGQLVATVTQRR